MGWFSRAWVVLVRRVLVVSSDYFRRLVGVLSIRVVRNWELGLGRVVLIS